MHIWGQFLSFWSFHWVEMFCQVLRIKLSFHRLSCAFLPWRPSSWAKQLWTWILPSKSCTCCSPGFPVEAQHRGSLIRCTREGTHKRTALALFKEKTRYKNSINKVSPKYTHRNTWGWTDLWLSTFHMQVVSTYMCLFYRYLQYILKVL